MRTEDIAAPESALLWRAVHLRTELVCYIVQGVDAVAVCVAHGDDFIVAESRRDVRAAVARGAELRAQLAKVGILTEDEDSNLRPLGPEPTPPFQRGPRNASCRLPLACGFIRPRQGVWACTSQRCCLKLNLFELHG